MNIAINNATHARIDSVDVSGKKTYAIVEDRFVVTRVGPYTFSHDLLSLVDLYQQLFEVNKCLLKTRIVSTYKMLMEERNRLNVEIQCRIDAANR